MTSLGYYLRRYYAQLTPRFQPRSCPHCDLLSVSFGEKDAVFLEKAGKPCRGNLVFHPPL